MTTIIYWFRKDLRIQDNLAFTQACADANHLLPVFIHPANHDEQTSWGFPRVGHHSNVFLKQSLSELKDQLEACGSSLLELHGGTEEVFQILRKQTQSNVIYCEQIEAPEEITQLDILTHLDFEVRQFWQSSMLDPKDLPFDLKNMPDVFTIFRKSIEEKKLSHAKSIGKPENIPPLPPLGIHINQQKKEQIEQINFLFKGGEMSALAHLSQYFERRLPDTYKQTRNQLTGMDYSSKFSPWLAFGCCSARDIVQRLREYESTYGANDGTYWLWFELLWRDYFRFLHFKYGKKLYHSRGLGHSPSNRFDPKKFMQWRSGETGEALIDAGMRELYQTGFLSNRMRQIVASYWIYDMKGDWRAGAAWFESQLVDYDVYSNQGNWLYIAGCGTDPRGGRQFNVKKQSQDHDFDGSYRAKWLSNWVPD